MKSGTTSARTDLLTGGTLLLMLALPPGRELLEAHMAGHMLVQIPLLVAAGAWLGGALPNRWRDGLQTWNAHGLPGLLLAVFTLGLWLLPRSLDAALQEPAAATLKFVTLPVLAGVALRLSWPRLPSVARGVVWSNLLAMLGVMSWLYLEAPLRVCNNYLQNDQLMVGKLLLGILGVLGATLAVRVFAGVGSGFHDEALRDASGRDSDVSSTGLVILHAQTACPDPPIGIEASRRSPADHSHGYPAQRDHR